MLDDFLVVRLSFLQFGAVATGEGEAEVVFACLDQVQDDVLGDKARGAVDGNIGHSRVARRATARNAMRTITTTGCSTIHKNETNDEQK